MNIASIRSVAEAYAKMAVGENSQDNLAATDAELAQKKQEPMDEIPAWVPGNIPAEKKKEFAEAAKKAWESDNTQFDYDGRTYKITEKLVGNQDKLDVNGNGKIDGEDLAALRAGKKPEMEKEELVGNQHKLDVNHNGKIDGDDLAALRSGEKQANEHHLENEVETPGQSQYPGSGIKDVNGNGIIDGEDKADEAELEESVRLKKASDMERVNAGAMSMADYKKKWANIKSKPKNPADRAVKEGAEENPIDRLTLDVPAMIRSLEKAREDFKSDEDVHNFVQDLLKKKDATIDTNALPTNESLDALLDESLDAILAESLGESLDESSAEDLDLDEARWAKVKGLDYSLLKKHKNVGNIPNWHKLPSHEKLMTNALSFHGLAHRWHKTAKKIAADGHAGTPNHEFALKTVKRYQKHRDYWLRRANKEKKAETKNESVNEANALDSKISGKQSHSVEFDHRDLEHIRNFLEKPHHESSKAGLHRILSKHFDKMRKPAEVNEKLDPKADAGEWISDFVHSNDPKFAGKSKEERTQQALAAYYQARRDAGLKESTTEEMNKVLNENIAGDHRASDLTTKANQASALAHSTPDEAGALAHHDAATQAHQHAADHYRVYAQHASDPVLKSVAQIHHKYHSDMAHHHTMRGVNFSMGESVVNEGAPADAKGGPEVMDPKTKKMKDDADNNVKAEEAPYTNKADGSENVVPADKPKANPTPMPKLTKEQAIRSVAEAYAEMLKSEQK